MPIPVISVARMREWEKASWAAGKSEAEVIRRVGHLVAERAHRMLRTNDSVVAFHGRGNNGADVMQASRLFVDHEVHRVESIHAEAALSRFESLLELKPSLILDGIFGIGLNRPLDEGFCRLVEAINASGIPVLSVDVPSGMDADTGMVGTSAVKAAVTLTLGAPKRGLLRQEAWPYVGRLEVAPNIGLLEGAKEGDEQWILDHDFTGYPPMRLAWSHKGSHGHVCIVAGSAGYHGAAVLASRGAQRAQPGLVTLLTSQTVYPAVSAQTQATMVRAVVEGAPMELPVGTSCVVFGPGLADSKLSSAWGETLIRWWEELEIPLVVDASALDWIPAGGRPAGIRVVTPHPGEAARMLGVSVSEVQHDRAGALRGLSGRYGGCWVVLKGHQTLLGRNEGVLMVNGTGNPYLAQGGAGDVLAGWLGGWMAQYDLRKKGSESEVRQMLSYAVWKHGRVADQLQATVPGWTIEDFVGAKSWGDPPAGHPMKTI